MFPSKQIEELITKAGWTFIQRDNTWAYYQKTLQGEDVVVEVPLRQHATDYNRVVESFFLDLEKIDKKAIRNAMCDMGMYHVTSFSIKQGLDECHSCGDAPQFIVLNYAPNTVEKSQEALTIWRYDRAKDFPGEYVIFIGREVFFHSPDRVEAFNQWGPAWDQAGNKGQPAILAPDSPDPRRPSITRARTHSVGYDEIQKHWIPQCKACTSLVVSQKTPIADAVASYALMASLIGEMLQYLLSPKPIAIRQLGTSEIRRLVDEGQGLRQEMERRMQGLASLYMSPK